MTADRDGCPCWCAHHTVSRCRSTPHVLSWRRGRLRVEFGVQLERHAGCEPVVALLLPADLVGPLLLPLPVADELAVVVGELAEAGVGLAASPGGRGGHR